MTFYICRHCGNIIAYAENKGVPVVCCGEKMQALVPGVVEASHEKHVPVMVKEENHITVKVGAAAHPMTAEHAIRWIALETKQGNQRKELQDVPQAEFMLCAGDEVVAAYAYCNLHGLWKA